MGTGMDSALLMGTIPVQGLPQAGPPKNSKAAGTPAIDKTAKDFEAVFLSQMLSPMFDSVQEDSLGGNPETDEVYRSWMVEQYGRLIANAGGIGIAGYVKNELLRQQEIASGKVPGAVQPPTTSHP